MAQFSALVDSMNKRLRELTQEIPVGTPVRFSCDGWVGEATVIGHKFNMFGIPLIDVKLKDSDGDTCFYRHELRKL